MPVYHCFLSNACGVWIWIINNNSDCNVSEPRTMYSRQNQNQGEARLGKYQYKLAWIRLVTNLSVPIWLYGLQNIKSNNVVLVTYIM